MFDKSDLTRENFEELLRINNALKRLDENFTLQFEVQRKSINKEKERIEKEGIPIPTLKILEKQEEKIKSDFLKKVIGKDFEKISNILKSNPDSNFELYLNGKPLNEHFKENN